MKDHPWRKHYLWIYLWLITVLAFTNYQEQHPDEWYQTIDIATLIVNNHSVSDAAYIHHRNLLIPTLLAVPIWLLKSTGWDTPYLIFTSIKFLIGLLNLVVLWGMHRLWRQEKPESPHGSHILWLAFCLTHLSLFEAIRPSLEHFSSIAFWAMVGCWTLTFRSSLYWILVGVFAVMTGAARYPSGLLGVIFVGLHSITFLRNQNWRSFALLCTGCFIGLIISFLPDFLFYGRAYESLYMYMLYNVFTDLASINFGKQSSFIYTTYLYKIFEPSYFLFLPIVIFGIIKGGFKSIKENKFWGYTFFIVVAAHLFPAHKEARFMSAFLFLGIFIALYGLEPHLKTWLSQKNFRRITALSLLIGFGHILEHTYNQLRSPRFLLSQISITNQNCLVSYKIFPSFMFPASFWHDLQSQMGVVDEEKGHIHWLKSQNLQCSAIDFFIHKRFEKDLTNLGCSSRSTPWPWSVVSDGRFFSCSTNIVQKNFEHQQSSVVAESQSFSKYDSLMEMNISPEQLNAWVEKQVQKNQREITLQGI